MPSEPIDLPSHKALSGVSRVAILEVLRSGAGAQDVQAVAAQVGLHTNTVRAHLDQLVAAGLVEASSQVRTTPGRPRVLFRATPAAPADEAGAYKLLAGILASTLDADAPEPGATTPGSVAAAAGRRWGRTVAATEPRADAAVVASHEVERIVAVLDEVGFAPRLRERGWTDPAAPDDDGQAAPGAVIELHRCPFREVALEHSDVVCGIHLGLMQGAVEQMGAPGTSIRLEPFVRPDLCLAHVDPARPADLSRAGGAA